MARLVFGHPEHEDGAVSRHAYAFCVLEQFWRHLKRREIWARHPPGSATRRPGASGLTVVGMASEVFVGRGRELAVLTGLAARARADQPRVVLIEGDAGMGKSSLLAKFVPAVGGAAVLRASGDEGESKLGYGVISQVVSAARSLGVATPALLRGELADSIDPLAVGAELLSVFDALGRSGELTLLVVDDLHWSDPPSARPCCFACAAWWRTASWWW